MSRVLVTGATGLIGREVVRQLARSGREVHALANRREIPVELQAAAVWHEADLQNGDAVGALLEQITPAALMHLAWPTVAGTNNHDVNHQFLAASQELVRRFYDAGGARALIAGTCFEYDWSEGLCSEETTPLRPNSIYGRCKDELRQSVQKLAEANGRGWAWGRIFFVYGPHQSRDKFVPAVIDGLLNRQPVLCTAGHQIRDYLHAEDVASALIHLLNSKVDGACNIGAGQSVTLRELASEIARNVGGEELLRFGAKPTPAGEPPMILADVNRLHRELGWRPRFSLAQGLADVIEHRRHAGRAPLSV